MKTIKFRGKRLGNGEWVYGDLLQGLKDDKYIVISHDEGVTKYEVDPDTVGQFTGLKDKNGNEIYEGDILRVTEFKNAMWDVPHEFEDFDVFTLDELKGQKIKEYVTPVIGEDGCFLISSKSGDNDTFLTCLFGDMKRSFPIFDFELIGNIHDNPELLKGGEE